MLAGNRLVAGIAGVDARQDKIMRPSVPELGRGTISNSRLPTSSIVFVRESGIAELTNEGRFSDLIISKCLVEL
jgi:hypothetical protein